jgi:hypothetical protein
MWRGFLSDSWRFRRIRVREGASRELLHPIIAAIVDGDRIR